MNLHRLDLVSLLLFNPNARGAASRRITDLDAALETDAARAPFEDREGRCRLDLHPVPRDFEAIRERALAR